MAAQTVILKSEIYNFHRLDLTRQAGFIVTVYDEDGFEAGRYEPVPNPYRGVCGSGSKKSLDQWTKNKTVRA